MIYQLKRRYGKRANIVWRVSSTTDLETGKRTIPTDSQSVERAILLPTTVAREFDKNTREDAFQYGGLFDARTRTIIIDLKELPADFKIKNDYWIVFDTERYEITEYTLHMDAYFIKAKQIENIEPGNDVQLAYYEFLNLKQTVTAVVT